MLEGINFYEAPSGRLRRYRVQKNVTVSKEQKLFIQSNAGKMSIGKIAAMLGLTYGKTHKNMVVMGLYKPQPKAKIIEMEGYFDIDTFGKQYNY